MHIAWLIALPLLLLMIVVGVLFFRKGLKSRADELKKHE